MPIYEYACLECEGHTDVQRTIADRNNCPLCDKCGAKTRKILSAPMLLAETCGLKTPYDYLDGKVPDAKTIRTGWGGGGERLPFNKRKPDTEKAD